MPDFLKTNWHIGKTSNKYPTFYILDGVYDKDDYEGYVAKGMSEDTANWIMSKYNEEVDKLLKDDVFAIETAFTHNETAKILVDDYKYTKLDKRYADRRYEISREFVDAKNVYFIIRKKY